MPGAKVKPVAGVRRQPRERRLNIRASERQENLIRQGAQAQGVSLTDFILHSACLEAEHVLADKHHFTLPPAKWAAFLAALDRPPVLKPQLRKLFSTAGVFDSQRNEGTGKRKRLSSSIS